MKHEEIELTPEDEAALDAAMAKIRQRSRPNTPAEIARMRAAIERSERVTAQRNARRSGK